MMLWSILGNKADGFSIKIMLEILVFWAKGHLETFGVKANCLDGGYGPQAHTYVKT